MLVKNSIIYGSTTVIKGIFSFLRIAIYTRMLSPAEYGDFAVVMSLVGFTDAFAFQWVRQAVMRHITHEKSHDDIPYLSNALLIYGLLSVLAIAVSAVMLFFGVVSGAGFTLVYELLGLIVVTEALSNLMILMARVRLKHGLFFILNVIKPVLSMVLGVALIYSGMSVSGALYGLLIALALACFIGAIGTDDFRAVRLTFVSKDVLRGILTFGLPLIIVFSLQSAIKATDRILLNVLIGNDITGLYAAAQDIPFRLLNLLAQAIHLAAYPLAVRQLDHDSEESCRKQLAVNFTFMFGIMIPAAIGMAVLAPGMASIFVGAAFRPFAVDYLGFFVAVSFINCVTQYYFILPFNLAKKNRLLVIPFLTGAVLNLVIGWFAIPVYGAGGAIVGSFLAYSMVLAVILILGHKIFPVPVPVKSLAQIVFSAIVMGAVVYMIGGCTDNVILFFVSVLAGISVYGAMVFAFDVGQIRAKTISYIKSRKSAL